MYKITIEKQSIDPNDQTRRVAREDVYTQMVSEEFFDLAEVIKAVNGFENIKS